MLDSKELMGKLPHPRLICRPLLLSNKKKRQDLRLRKSPWNKLPLPRLKRKELSVSVLHKRQKPRPIKNRLSARPRNALNKKPPKSNVPKWRPSSSKNVKKWNAKSKRD